MKIIDYLKNHTFNDLKEAYNIKINVNEGKTKVSLNYDQVFSPKFDDIVGECRGLVLRPQNKELLLNENWDNLIVGDVKVLARPMLRFYNWEEYENKNAIKINLNKCKAYEKLDGTCIIFYYDDLINRWCVATRSLSEANCVIYNQITKEAEKEEKTFATIFWEILNKKYQHVLQPSQHYLDLIDQSLDNSFNKEYTYIFELISKYNRIVVNYKEEDLVLLSVIHNESGKEYLPEDVDLDFTKPKCWNLTSISEIRDFINKFPAHEFEGVVLCDDNFNRAKVKSENYLLAHKIQGSLTSSKRNIIEAIANDTIDYAIAFLDEDSKILITEMKSAYENFVQEIQNKFQSLYQESNGDRKTFAIAVNNNKLWSKIYFTLFSNDTNNRDVKIILKSFSENNRLTRQDLDYIESQL